MTKFVKKSLKLYFTTNFLINNKHYLVIYNFITLKIFSKFPTSECRYLLRNLLSQDYTQVPFLIILSGKWHSTMKFLKFFLKKIVHIVCMEVAISCSEAPESWPMKHLEYFIWTYSHLLTFFCKILAQNWLIIFLGDPKITWTFLYAVTIFWAEIEQIKTKIEKTGVVIGLCRRTGIHDNFLIFLV